MPETFNYGGQAVIEGVMIRGQRNLAVAVRRPNGELALRIEPLSARYTETLRKIPLVRGTLVLAETLILGMRALLYSANVSLDQEEEISPTTVWVMAAVGILFAVALFFLAPLLIMRWLDTYMPSSITSNLVEGAIRLVFFVGYLKGISLLPDIRRVFAYHGAEHKTINAYEDGVATEVERIQKYSKAHARCGTSFLLIVFLVAILIFALLGQPPLWLRFLSRVLLIPVIAGISYEIIRFGARHAGNSLVKALLSPGLALQAMTTREPDDRQVEVAVCALQGVLVADGREKATGE